MRGRNEVLPAILAVLMLAGCRKANPLKSLRPIEPKKPVPVGTVRFQFTRKVSGPVELVVDSVRVPVEQPRKVKKARALTITGLANGKHKYFLSSQRDAFSPDQGEFELEAAKGLFFISFTQHFDAVLYGKPEPLPKAEGIPGVKAILEP